MKLSIIVPIYNVAPYLRKCVDSLLAQDIIDYEIILVDDGSTDDSGVIADEIVRETMGNGPKLSVIHQPNAGLSEARNTGINAALGEYVCFVDSDDYWEENVLGALIQQVEREKLDVLRFDYQNVRQKANGEYEVFQPNKYPHPVDMRCDIVDGETYLNERMGYDCYAVQFIVHREIVCKFLHGIHAEDIEWLPRMMLTATRVNATSLMVYNYLVRLGSITNTGGVKNKMRRNIEDCLLVIQKLSFLEEKYPNCQWLERMISTIVSNVLKTIALSFNDEQNKYIRRLQDKNVFPLIIANQGRTFVFRARIINIFGARIYCTLIRLYYFLKETRR